MFNIQTLSYLTKATDKMQLLKQQKDLINLFFLNVERMLSNYM